MSKNIYKNFISLFSALIPIRKYRKKFRNLANNAIDYYFCKKFFKKAVGRMQDKLKNNAKINVVFLVIFDSVFPAKPLFEKMLEDDCFAPKLLIVPDISRGDKNQFYQLQKSYNFFVNLYGKDFVMNSYESESKTFLDPVEDFDIACFANPYDAMTMEVYSIEYYVKNKVLPIYISYGTMPDYYAREHIINLKSLNLCWKVFVDTKENFDDVVCYTDQKGQNAVLSGYCKMDELAEIKHKILERKKIIIAPHHTVSMPSFALSNFLEYSNFFLELPLKYPQIDFVFRPHPLLFVTLSAPNLWGKEKVTEYINKISSYPNVEYQNGGDYFDTFLNSSAIIHDCSSFLMEYLYTGHPACYMLKNKKEIKEIFAPIGQQCLKNYYHAFNKEDIIRFIENVVIANNDPMKKERVEFAKEKIMLNYPNVADYIIKNIKEELK